jgi:hypothetical protein
MSRRSSLFVLGLLALLGLTLLFHRSPREIKPPRLPKPVAAAVPPVPEPPIPAASVEPPKPAPIAPPTPTPAPVEVPPIVVPVDPIKPGNVRGIVTILGVPPVRKRIKMDADPKCRLLHPGEVLSDQIVADPRGRVRWAFVYVSQGNTPSSSGTLPPVLLDQVGCRFDPHVLGVQVNQPLNIFNNDPLLHNVHASTIENKEFNFGLPAAGLVETKRFTRKEIMVRINCDVHPWMKAWVGVLDHPFFSVTSDTGGYAIVNLPPGRVRITVWHEAYASVEAEIDVPSGGDAQLDFFLDARK